MVATDVSHPNQAHNGPSRYGALEHERSNGNTGGLTKRLVADDYQMELSPRVELPVMLPPQPLPIEQLEHDPVGTAVPPPAIGLEVRK